MARLVVSPIMAGSRAFNEGRGLDSNPFISKHQRKLFEKGWRYGKDERAMKEIQKKSGWK